VSLPVAEALRRFYVDDLVHDDAVLELLMKTFGPERVLAGSDWPFPMGSDGVSAARAAACAVTAEALTRPLAKEVAEC
jgi:aminocarboxymuconate-semialdehyde decarboxylase